MTPRQNEIERAVRKGRRSPRTKRIIARTDRRTTRQALQGVRS